MLGLLKSEITNSSFIASMGQCWPLHLLLGLFFAATLPAAEKRFDFADVAEGQPPPGFRSTVTGEGSPGDWRVIQAEVTPAPNAEGSPVRKSVLAQLSTDPRDERFPLLLYESEVFSDFTLSTRFKTVDGRVERMAGLVFRAQNETNYYVVRASSLGNTFRFYKVVNGQRGTIIGPELSIPSGVWHEMSVECKGNQIRCFLNGKEAIPAITDSSFVKGKFGFWTKSDSITYFTETRVIYIPSELPARRIIREVADRYDRLIDLQLYVANTNGPGAELLASKVPQAGTPEGETESKVLESGRTYYGKTRNSVSVVMPIRDRNGEIIAATRVVMETFKGQTEQNAIIRAGPIVKSIQARVQILQDLYE
jgi:hypothetical protein